MPPSIPARRLVSQGLARPTAGSVAEVVHHLGAVQAQDYLGSLWAIGVRLPGSVDADVERAVAERTIVRTWPLRGTLHWVAAADVRWMLELLAPRVVAGSAGRHRQLGLDAALFAKARALLTKALRDGNQLTRPGVYQILARGKVPTHEGRGLHLLGRLAQEGLICFGPREGKQQTFRLLEEWLPEARPLPREEALAELARRYFAGHGPAQIGDFRWWSGLTMRDATVAIALAGRALIRFTIDGKTYLADGSAPARPPRGTWLLPPFDQYTVGYSDRSAVLDPGYARRVNAGGGIFRPIIVVDGRVVGTWTRTLGRDRVTVTPELFPGIDPALTRSLAGAARRYGEFLGQAPVLARVTTGRGGR